MLDEVIILENPIPIIEKKLAKNLDSLYYTTQLLNDES